MEKEPVMRPSTPCTAATFHADWDEWVAAVVRQGPNRRKERR